MKHTPRKLLKVLSAAFAVAALSGVATSASAEQQVLYVGMNGGDMERAFTQHVFPPFEKANNVKVVVVPGTSADVLAKAQAFKDNPQMHVMFLDDGVMSRAVSMGLCEKLKPSAELEELYPSARMKGDMSSAVTMDFTGIAYNPKMFAEQGWAKPTSWQDFADPKLKGKVVVQSASSSSYGLHTFLMINRIAGGTEANVDPAFSSWKDTVGKNVLEYIPNSSKLSEMLQTGEVAMFPLTRGATIRMQKRDLPVEFVVPKEGAVLLSVAQCVIAKNSKPELAQALARYLISQEAQNLVVKHSGNGAANAKAIVEPEMQAALADAIVLDWDQINQQRAEWNVRWNRTIER